MAQPETEAELTDALGRLLDHADGASEGHRVERLHRLSGGASRETWSFEAVDADGARQPLILQRVRPGAPPGGPSLAAEDALLAAAQRAGVPVPRVVADTAMAEPFLSQARVTAHIEGETLGPRIVRADEYATARSRLAGQCARALAAIHSIDPQAVPGLEPVDTLERLRMGLDFLGEHRPAFELALRWLAANQPPRGPTRVVHGDFRVGNLIVDQEGLQAVLDWELAHLGDPLEDLGWLCVRAWRFGGAGEVGGVAPIDDLLAEYRAATGAEASAEAVRWWIVTGTLTWGMICAVQARRHLDGHIRSVELATIGRRVCETEYDLVQLLGIGSPADPADDRRAQEVPAGSAAGTTDGFQHGRPTAAELIDAVRGHLADRVAPALSGAAAFHLKVAGNALAIVERELQLGAAMATAGAERLERLGYVSEVALAAAIRAGELDHRADVDQAVRAAVVDRVRVANPRWLEQPDQS